MLLQLILIGLGIALLLKGADFLVDGSSKIAKRFNISEIVIGLTIVSIGTSLPELVISVSSAFKGLSDISMGNVIGSNMANLFLIISLCSVMRPLKIRRETKFFEIPFTVLCTAIYLAIVDNDGVIDKYEGIILLGIFGLYLVYNLVMLKAGRKLNGENQEEESEKEESQTKLNKVRNSVFYSIVQIVIGIVALKFGGDFVVDNAVLIAKSLGISEKLIGITIVAFGTSLPELITCLSATRRGDDDLAIGNIIGSQIFNILLIIGLSAVVSPIHNVAGYREELLILLIGNIIFAIIPFVGQKDKIGRATGIAFVCFYLVYMFNMVQENLMLQ